MKRNFLKVAILSFVACCCGLSVATAQLLSSAVNQMDIVGEQMAILQDATERAEYIEALTAYKKSLEALTAHNEMLAATGDTPDQYVEDRIHLLAGDLFVQMGDYKEGYARLQNIKTDSLLARKYIQLSRMRHGQGRYAEAIKLLDSAQLINKDERFKNIIIQNIGFTYWAMGDLESADKYFAQAQQNMRHKRDRNYHIVLENRAIVHSQQGRHQEAIAEIAEVVKFFEKGNDDNQIALRKCGEVLTRADRAKEAQPYFSRYFNAKRDDIVANLSKMTRQQRLNLWAKERPLLSKCFMLEDNASEFLFEVAMFRRQLSLLGNSDYAKLLSATPSQVRASLKANEAAVEFIRYTDKSGEEWYAAIVLPKEGRARFVKLLKVDDIYEPEVVGSQSIYNVIKREEMLEINDLYSSKEVGDSIWAPILSAITTKTKRLFFAPEGIFNMWGIENMPFTNMGKVELYRVSSTTSLIDRNSQSALDFNNSPKLIIGGLDYDEAVVDSLQQKPNREAREILARQTGCDGGFFKYLKGTFAESESIAKMCNSQSTHQLGELTIKSVMSKYGVIHIATHGYSLSTNVAHTPEFLLDSVRYDRSLSACGIALSGANVSTNANSEDGILSAKEICDLDLSNVAFVVLSACQTAKGDIVDDGAAGLVRGLKNAGVKTILATLWSIDDNSTLLFMEAFYKQLSNGQSPYKALKLAQQILAKSSYVTYRRKFSPKTLASDREVTKEVVKYDSPFYYAPFILIDATIE